jgi:signal transduction histidine kinase
MRLWPDSLFGRLFLATIAVVVITLSVILALIVRERQEFALLESAAGDSLSSIAATAQNLARLSPAERAQELAELRDQRRSREATRRARLSARRENRELLERAVVARLQQQLGEQFEVRALGPGGPPRDSVALFDERPREPGPAPGGPRRRTPDRPPFALEVVLPDGEAVAFRMPQPRPGPALPTRLFVDFGLLTLALSVVLYAMTRTITRPLGKLAQAADAVGRGKSVAPLPEQGGRELRAATRAFNAMQERLRRYLDSRTRVLAAMSHDMRTPLTRLRLRVESIDDEALRARCTADLDEMSDMIRGALAVFRGMNDEEPATPIDINVFLEALRDEHIELGGIVTLIGRAQQPYLGKPLALRRCLGNLIQNAIQYGNQANITIEDEDALTIRIRDRGPGIPADALEQVFEPFFRLEASRNRNTGGTGLGLSIARDIAQAHGGTVALRNVDSGLEAELRLPRSHER